MRSSPHVGKVVTWSLNVVFVVVCIVSSSGAFGMGGSKHWSSAGISRKTVMGTASSSGRVSSLKMLLFVTARNWRLCVISSGWYCQ
jgi:hypothetical protein